MYVKIGDKGLTTYTSNYNLDFSSFGDEVKAYVATGYDYDTKTIWLTRVKDVPAGTALMVKGTGGKTYDVPVKETSGSYYKNMFVGNTSGSAISLSETSDGMTNYYLKDGQFWSVSGSANIVDGKSYLQIPTSAPTALAGGGETLNTNDYGFASYCGSQDLDFTDVEGLKAYAATGYDDATGIIWLTRVMRVSAGTPLLLKGAATGSYTVPSSSVSSYYANMLKGNLSGSTITIFTTDGDMTNYFLKVISMKVGTRGIDEIDGETTGIIEVKDNNADRGEWYNLNGQRVRKPNKGVYINRGIKILVK